MYFFSNSFKSCLGKTKLTSAPFFFLFECLQSFQIKSQEEIIQMYHDTIDNQDCEGINPSYAPFSNPKKNKMLPPHQKNLLLN